MPVEFSLVYRGPLHANGSARERMDIREQFHPQLRALCQKPTSQFRDALPDNLPLVKWVGGVYDMPRPIEIAFYRWAVGDFEFTPLISHVHDLACGLEIEWFRHEAPGAVIGGGDLDNRLKTLIDGLRMPREVQELAGATTGEGNRRRFSLLDDDRQISRFSVRTYELLGEAPSGHRSSEIEAVIHVTVIPLSTDTYMNIGF